MLCIGLAAVGFNRISLEVDAVEAGSRPKLARVDSGFYTLVILGFSTLP